jgi:hypothetical protein
MARENQHFFGLCEKNLLKIRFSLAQDSNEKLLPIFKILGDATQLNFCLQKKFF